MTIVPITLHNRPSDSLLRLADKLATLAEQSDAVLLALGMPREHVEERRGYVLAEIDVRYRVGCDDRVTAWVEAQWQLDSPEFDAMIASLPPVTVHPNQLAMEAA